MTEIKCSPKEILNNNAVKLGKFKEIISDACGFLNHSHGGSIFLVIDDREENAGKGFKAKPMRTFLRGIEQRLRDTFGEIVYCIGIERIEHSDNKVEFLVKSGKNVGIEFFTVKTNLYLPGHEEVHQVSSLELSQSILCRTVIWKMVSIHTHIKLFEKNTDSNLIEGRTLQLKNLESCPSKRTALADRITSKGNKFTYYVAAFANFSGGHIYYGINDNRVVEGQIIPSEDDKRDVTKKVEKAINKMIWPEQIGQPKQGEHWEIFFEPVVDKNLKHIPLTFVIVIYIAPCVGGVFPEEPESYEMVEGRRKKMSLSAWRRRLFSSIRSTEYVPPEMKRITWSKRKVEQVCTKIVNTAMEYINNGQYELSEVLMYYKEKFPRVIDVNLTTISRDVMGCIRTGNFEKAYSLLKRYNEILPQAEDVMIFETLLLFLLVCLRRCEGQLNKDWSLIDDLINRTVLLPPGFLTAAIYAVCTTVSPEEHSGLSIPVLCEKTRIQVRDCLLDQDVAWKVDIFQAFHSLGCDFSEGLFLKDLGKVNLEAAKSYIAHCEGQLTNSYRKTQHFLAKSVLYVRYSQFSGDDKELCLEIAWKCCMEAERIANNCQFYEMINLAKHIKNVCASQRRLTSSSQ